MFQLKSNELDMLNDELVSRVTRGISRELAKEAPFLPQFVSVWSGGKEGSVLQEIERWEQSNQIKRKLKGADLKQMAGLPVHKFRKWVPAMLKASIVAPKEFLQTGLWTAADFSSLKSGNPKIMAKVNEALEDINSAHAYVDAHVRDKMDDQDMFVTISTLEQDVFICGITTPPSYVEWIRTKYMRKLACYYSTVHRQ